MRYFLLFVFFSLYATCSLAQKPPIDTSVFDKWPSVGTPAISNNGHYVVYTINNQPTGNSTLVIQATRTKWKMEIPGVVSGAITQDSRKALFIKPGDSLCILTLDSVFTEYIPHVYSFRLFKQGDNECLIYQLNNPAKELVIQDLGTGNKNTFTAIVNYWLSDNGNTLLLQSESMNDNIITYWVDLPGGKMISIGQGANAGGFVFDKSGTQLAFTKDEKVNNQSAISLWYYKQGTDKAVQLADNQSAGIDNGLRLDNIERFSNDGSRLFFNLKERDYPILSPDAVKVDIWSYKDPKLQSQQLSEVDPHQWRGGPRSYSAVIGIQEHHIIRLQQENETILFFREESDDVAFISNSKGDYNEKHWNPAAQPFYYIISTRNGKRKEIKLNAESFPADISPGGKYLIATDTIGRDYFSYELGTDVIRNITRTLPIPFVDNEYEEVVSKSRGMCVTATWLDNDAGFLLYDKYDIWLVDPLGHVPPVNLTNGYGRQHNIVFRLAKDYQHTPLSGKEQLVLSAFNRNTKDNGFYSKVLNQKGDPVLLTMGAYVYDVHLGPISFISTFPPLKARDTALYLVRRESASQSPNYFTTTDFKTFPQLSAVYPEANYNWLRSELMIWKTPDNRLVQGVLYKPENFDPGKKYPVIFHYYERLSDRLNLYEKPEAAGGWLNIPWFVSNDYLVFTPDIHYTIGEPGKNAYNSVISAAKYLARLPYINTTKMGIQGHSFGGYETNYLITHTNKFAAACSSSGFCDLISAYGSVMSNGGAPFFSSWAETGHGRIGATLWQRPGLYIKNSPIFQTDKVTTPLLMMNNKDDGIVPFAQGVEFFTALRRLNKKVWLLQYDGEKHSLFDNNATKDYTIRITQFFDYYLKGHEAPKWMTEGISTRLKGIKTGLGRDTSGKKP
ncbi:Dipeptidyl aminopeptidase/acylaminoacyl peptidase [Chitinophaga sp. YR573]|uniref:alpha/beta hydrolase family protein n=1 Tax=Chitinophaga sp. YR573 TaxID=1881040 RepID=UPI0008C57488|nr:prolyl oligopeptidase family serine peptidase [Chitinophaga sp. YR573]SEW03855.1 Dipeptidyl aminopeptidase/acylaminoacyl peptidase [Chitinophaga sp. YR573]